MTHRIGVCSWSLQPESPEDLAVKVTATGVRFVQLALDPLVAGEWAVDDTMGCLRNAGIEVLSGMMGTAGENYETLDSIRDTGGVRLDEHWSANLNAAHETAILARELRLPLVTLHAGFIPADSMDPIHNLMLARLRALVGRFYEQGVRVGFETGQETASTLIAAHDALALPNLGVNFDPANMILYDMGDPIESLRLVADHVLQIHIKDATRTKTPGTWGEEVPSGTGEVDWDAFFDVVRENDLNVDLMIEREAGNERVADIRDAREMVESKLGVTS